MPGWEYCLQRYRSPSPEGERLYLLACEAELSAGIMPGGGERFLLFTKQNVVLCVCYSLAQDPPGSHQLLCLLGGVKVLPVCERSLGSDCPSEATQMLTSCDCTSKCKWEVGRKEGINFEAGANLLLFPSVYFGYWKYANRNHRE